MTYYSIHILKLHVVRRDGTLVALIIAWKQRYFKETKGKQRLIVTDSEGWMAVCLAGFAVLLFM